jgi:hypothetical protein
VLNRFLPPGLAGAPFRELCQLGLLLILSWQLLAAKRANATLRGEISRGTRAFVAGDSLPALPVLLADGSRVEAPGFCDGKSALLLVISSPACVFCRTLAPEWRTLAGREGLAVLVVETGPEARSASTAGNLYQATAENAAIVQVLGIREVPAVLLSGPDCRIEAAGSGLTASRAVLSLAREHRPTDSTRVQTLRP